jgi:replicative DNA helicase
MIILLHREDYYHKSEPGYFADNVAEFILEKQRKGPTGTVKLVYDGRITKFRNMAHHDAVGWAK